MLDQNATALKVPRAAYTILKADAMREVTYTRAKETFGHLRRPNKEVDSLKWARPSAYDYVFLDPPYAFTDDQVEKILQRLLETEGLTGSDSVVVIESGKARALESVQRGARFEEVLVKKYGTTVMQFLEVKS